MKNTQYYRESYYNSFIKYSKEIEEALYEQKVEYDVIKTDNAKNIVIATNEDRKIVNPIEILGISVYLFPIPKPNRHRLGEKKDNEGLAITNYSEEKIELLKAGNHPYKVEFDRIFIPLGNNSDFKFTDELYIENYGKYRKLGEKIEEYEKLGIFIHVDDVVFLNKTPEIQLSIFPSFMLQKYKATKNSIEKAFYFLEMAKALTCYDDSDIKVKMYSLCYAETYEFSESLKELIDDIKTSQLSLDYTDKYLPFRSDLLKHLTPEYLTKMKEFFEIN